MSEEHAVRRSLLIRTLTTTRTLICRCRGNTFRVGLAALNRAVDSGPAIGRNCLVWVLVACDLLHTGCGDAELERDQPPREHARATNVSAGEASRTASEEPEPAARVALRGQVDLGKAGRRMDPTYTGREEVCVGGQAHFAEVTVQAWPVQSRTEVALSPSVLNALRTNFRSDFEEQRRNLWACVTAQLRDRERKRHVASCRSDALSRGSCWDPAFGQYEPGGLHVSPRRSSDAGNWSIPSGVGRVAAPIGGVYGVKSGIRLTRRQGHAS